MRGEDLGAPRSQRRDCIASGGGIERLNGIGNDGDAAATLKKAMARAANAVFRNDTKNKKFRLLREAIDNRSGVRALEDILCLFFEQDLLIRKQIGRQNKARVIRDSNNGLRQGFGNKLSSLCTAEAVRWEKFKFRIVLRVVTTTRDEKRTSVASEINETVDVRNELFRSGNVELPAWKHEVNLRVYFPEDKLLLFKQFPQASCSWPFQTPGR